MKILGKNSLLYWLKFPYAIYIAGFIINSFWIFGLMAYFSITDNINTFITKATINGFQYDDEQPITKIEMIQFKYPFSKMCLATENSTEGILLAFIGLASICFLLFYIFKIISNLSKEEIFTTEIIKNLKFLGYGLIVFGISTLLIDITDGFSRHYKSYDLTPPFFYVLSGLILIFIKEIFVKARKIQEENDLTI